MKMNFNSLVSLADLEPGREGVIHTIDSADPVGKRLVALGLRPDTPIRMLRRAPLGDPTVYELRGYRLCIRESEASRVAVRVEPQTE